MKTIGLLTRAWCSLFVLMAAWAPVFWWLQESRLRSEWEFHAFLWGLITLHGCVGALLVLNAWVVTISFGLMVRHP